MTSQPGIQILAVIAFVALLATATAQQEHASLSPAVACRDDQTVAFVINAVGNVSARGADLSCARLGGA